MLAWIGRRFTKFLGDGPLNHPAFAVLIGGLILLLIYMVPVLGFLTYKLLGWLGLGVVVYTIVLSMKREKPPAPAAAAAAAGGPVAPPAAPAHPVVAPLGAVVGDPIARSGWVPSEPASAGATAGAGTTTGTPSVPLVSPTPLLPPLPPMVAASLPRAGFLIRLYALAVVGLGFLWVAIDDDRQLWHDKIAGTVVVRVPKGVALI